MENLLITWNRFRCGKRSKKDVMLFEAKLADNLTELHQHLVMRTYEMVRIQRSIFRTRSRGTSTKQVCATDSCTILFTRNYIGILTPDLFMIRIRAGKIRVRTGRSTDFGYLQAKYQKITHAHVMY
jgi:hypothetical protein